MASTKRCKTISSSSLSAETIGNNDDLLLQIPVRLPVKPLVKFKSVSKHWLSLITNPKFSSCGYLPSSLCIRGLFLRTYKPGTRGTGQLDLVNLDCKHSNPPFQTLTSVDYPPEMRIKQSRNGLLLCSSIPSSRFGTKYYIFNPTTKEHHMLPPLSLASLSIGPFLAFDPLKSSHYKLICIHKFEIEEPDFHIEIYSSKSDKWRLLETTFSLNLDYGVGGGLFWNGGINFYTNSGPYLYFDMDKEQMKEMPRPNPDLIDRHLKIVKYFGESHGHLQIIELYHLPSTRFDVWEMKEDRSGWFLKHVSEFPGTIRSIDPFGMHNVFDIFCLVEGEREEDGSYMVLHIPANIIRYDLKTRSYKKLCDFPPAGSSDHRLDENAINFYNCEVHKHIESFVSVTKRRNGGASISMSILINGRMRQFQIQ